MGGESDTDPFLDAIGGLDTKIDDLQTLLLAKFDRLESVVDFDNAKTQIIPYLTTLKTIKNMDKLIVFLQAVGLSSVFWQIPAAIEPGSLHGECAAKAAVDPKRTESCRNCRTASAGP